jgi:hypothetical protein
MEVRMKTFILLLMMATATVANAQLGVNSGAIGPRPAATVTTVSPRGPMVTDGCGTNSCAHVTTTVNTATGTTVRGGIQAGGCYAAPVYTGAASCGPETRVIFKHHGHQPFKWRIVQQRVCSPCYGHRGSNYGYGCGRSEWRTISKTKVPLSSCY